MNFNRFISSIVMAVASAVAALGCGPFDALTSNPFVFHFYQEDDCPTIIDAQQSENIRLWQTLTSAGIPEDDIEDAVYGHSFAALNYAFQSGETDNQFLKWIITNQSKEIQDFLLLAKEVEELRLYRVSQWYYPENKSERYDSRSEADKFASVFSRCEQHKKGYLSDRYALQYVRSLIALGKYDECIDFYDKEMSKYADSNLFKRMAKGYVAGCLRHKGDIDGSNRMFAEVGDFNSIVDNKKSYFATLVKSNPESDVVKSRLNQWIGYGDRDDNLPYLSIADAALNSSKVVNRGDWLYLKAYIEEIYNGDHRKAASYLSRALNERFSRDEMREDAKLMKLCIQAQQGNLSKDLRAYVETFKRESDPFYFYIVPELLRQGRVSEAILLANYASYREASQEYYHLGYTLYNDTYIRLDVPDNTYANTGFQLMLSRSAQEIVNYKRFLSNNSKLVKECIDKVRHDDDYLNEIIGTLYLREGNYDEAVNYLSQVSEAYQDNLNVKKDGYLFDNPWVNCYMPQDKWEYPAVKEDEIAEHQPIESTFDPSNSALLKSDYNAKLNFAREMARLAKVIKSGTLDEKGLARIRYALARYNSFDNCWALTQYWSGNANQCNYRPFFWTWDGGLRELEYLHDITGQVPNDGWLNNEIRRGLLDLQSDEAIAEAHFLVGNYLTIAQRFPDTQVGRYLSRHCDSWSEWL